MTIAAIRPAKLAETITLHIQKLILEGALQPGERLLSERDLSVNLDVSRPSLREALDRLVALGLLTTDANGSAYVSAAIGQSFADPLMALLDDPDATIDYLEFRAVIESAASAYAAKRASDIDRAALADLFGKMETAHGRGDPEEIARVDGDFHFAVYQASHNLVLLHFMRSFETALRSNVHLNRSTLYEHCKDETQLDQHREIFDAIMARDPERAAQAAQHHMTHALDTLRAVREAEKRLQVSIRRLGRSEIVAPTRGRRSNRRGTASTASDAGPV